MDLIERFYGNIGKKIKRNACSFGFFILICGIIATIVLLVMSFDDEEFLWIALSTLAGTILLFEISQVFYGFGQLFEDVHSVRDVNKESRTATSSSKSAKQNGSLSAEQQLTQYQYLLEKGKITREEFLAKKKQLQGK